VRRDRELACLFVGSGPLDRVIGLRGLKPVAERRVGLGAETYLLLLSSLNESIITIQVKLTIF
jgi:hypothetical protein